jgi:hypothetical protein
VSGTRNGYKSCVFGPGCVENTEVIPLLSLNYCYFGLIHYYPAKNIKNLKFKNIIKQSYI